MLAYYFHLEICKGTKHSGKRIILQCIHNLACLHDHKIIRKINEANEQVLNYTANKSLKL